MAETLDELIEDSRETVDDRLRREEDSVQEEEDRQRDIRLVAFLLGSGKEYRDHRPAVAGAASGQEDRHPLGEIPDTDSDSAFSVVEDLLTNWQNRFDVDFELLLAGEEQEMSGEVIEHVRHRDFDEDGIFKIAQSVSSFREFTERIDEIEEIETFLERRTNWEPFLEVIESDLYKDKTLTLDSLLSEIDKSESQLSILNAEAESTRTLKDNLNSDPVKEPERVANALVELGRGVELAEIEPATGIFSQEQSDAREAVQAAAADIRANRPQEDPARRSIRPGGGLVRPASDAPTSDGAVAGSNAAPDETNPYTGGIVSNAADATVNPEVGQARRIGSGTVEPSKPLDLSFLNPDTPGPPGPGGPPRLSAAEQAQANQAEVEALLASQFGGFSFFLQKHRSDLQVGLTADGQVVRADDPSAASVKNILDVIVEQGITAPTRVLGLLENTEWWSTTDARMREYDVLTADMSGPQKAEYLEPVLDLLRDEAQFLGFQLDPTRARDLAEQITRMGEETDSEYIRALLTAEESFNAAEVTASSFAAARDDIVAMSKRYFTPINEADAAVFAQDVYVGTNTAEGVEQYFREMAGAKFPQLANALNAGITPEQYFAPYKYEIERMLDRPNVDLYEDFGDVVEFIPDTGTGEARPMTLGEVRKYVRGLDEWQQSSQGTDSARALSFSIGKLFGEVA